MAILFDIACMGTSLTQGTGNDGVNLNLPYGSFTPYLEDALSVGKQSHVRIYNVGSGGAISDQGVSIQLPIVQLVKPKAVLIEFMINDCLGAGSGGLSTSGSTANHNTIITALKAIPSSPAIYLVTMNPVAGSGASAMARANLATYNAIYPTLVTSGVSLIDAYTAWGAGNLTDIPDGVHPKLSANIAKLIPTLVSAISGSIT